MSTELAPIEQQAIGDALSAASIKAQVQLIHDVMREAMIKDVHYGVIPGTTKPTLLKPGAQKLMLTFRFDPQFETTERFLGEHLFVKSKCVLYHITSGRRLGSGEASCSTKETKYAYRKGQRLCPHCGKEAIIKGQEQYGGGWLCWKKKDGCGAKWPDGAKVIEDQKTDRVANEDLADVYNTVLKMANKRSLIDAVLNVTGASDVFTQDIGDAEEEEHIDTPPPPPLPTGAEMLAKIEAKQDQASPSRNRVGPAFVAALKQPEAPSSVRETAVEEVMEDLERSEAQDIRQLKTLTPISLIIRDIENAPDDSAKIMIINEALAMPYSQSDKAMLIKKVKGVKK